MTFAAVSTVTVALFLVGSLGILYLRLASFADTIPSQFEIRVHLKDGTKWPQIEKAAKDLRGIPGVCLVTHIPRDKAWAKLKQEMPEETKGLENPLPDAFKIKLADLSKANSVRDVIKKMDVVDPNGIVYYEDAFNVVDQTIRFIKWIGSILGGLLFLTSGVLIHNAIRMSIIARRREIRIMQLIGATQFQVGTPFLVEGIIHGIVGGICATLLLWSASGMFRMLAESTSFFRLLQQMFVKAGSQPFPVFQAMGYLCLAGATFGLLCSILAVREPLKLK
jgi:cell division transport system permease protein